MTEHATDAYRIGRQRIVQSRKHDHALRPGDERSLCDKYASRALLMHEAPFVPGGEHSCDECTERLARD